MFNSGGCSADIHNDGIFITQYNVVLFGNLNFENTFPCKSLSVADIYFVPLLLVL